MKKILYILASLTAAACVPLVALGCNGDTESAPPPKDPSSPSEPSEPSTPTEPDEPTTPTEPDEPSVPTKKNYDMSGVGWDYASPFVYDGSAKTVSIVGDSLPNGVTVKSYTNNVKTDAGTYTASVTFEYDETQYNEPAVSGCTFVIEKAEMSGITFTDVTVEYDARPHSIAIVGNVPSGAEIKYTCNGVEGNEFTAVGVYSVSCTVTHKNYNTVTRTATLKITSTEERLFSASVGNSVYFQNNLDGNKLYSAASGGLKKINNDTPEYMTVNGGKLYYYSKSLLSKVVKSYDGTTVKEEFSAGGEYLTTDGTYLYYAVNNALVGKSDNGIYKYKIGESDDTATKLASDKAAYLVYLNGKIYYSNLDDGKKLYSVSANGGTGTALNDEAVSDLVTDGTNVYYNSSKTLAGIKTASAITRYEPASGNIVKLTTDSGKYLTCVGGEIYYINNDKITSSIFGDGIYKVSASRGESNLPGAKVLQAPEGNGYSSLASDGSYLYYYKLNDKHFYRNALSGNSETDLMQSFAPVDDTTLSGFSTIAVYDGEVYYTDPRDNGCVYKYNPTTGAKIKVLANSASRVYFNGNYMYYGTYVLTNYALNRLDLRTGESEKISSDRCDNLVFDGDLIFYVKRTATNNMLYKMKLDGSEDTLIYDDKQFNTNDFYKSGNDIIFNHNPKVGYQYILKYNIETKQLTDPEIRAKNFVVCNNKIYYYASDDSLKVCALDFSGTKTLKTDVTVNDMFVANNAVYFSSYSKNNTGLFKCDVSTDAVSKIYEKTAHGFGWLNGKLYFLQSNVSYVSHIPAQDQKSDGKLYCYDGTNVTKVA